MNYQTLVSHVADITKAALAVLAVQVLILVLQRLGILITDVLNYLGSVGAGVVAIKSSSRII